MLGVIKSIYFSFHSKLSVFLLCIQAILIGAFLSVYFVDATVNLLIYHGVFVLPEAFVASGIAGIIIFSAINASDSLKNKHLKFTLQYGFIVFAFLSLIVLKYSTYPKFFLFFYFAGFLPFGLIMRNIIQRVTSKIDGVNSYMLSLIVEAVSFIGVVAGCGWSLLWKGSIGISIENILLVILLIIMVLQYFIRQFGLEKGLNENERPIKSPISYLSELPLKTTLLITVSFILLSAISYTMVDYSFIYSLAGVSTNPISLTKFLILFFLITTVLSYVFKVFVYQNLIKTFKFNKAIIFPPTITIFALFCLSIMFLFPKQFDISSPYSLLFLALVFTRIFAQLIRESFEYYTLKLNLVAQESFSNRKIDLGILNMFNFWAIFFSGMILLILKSADINNLQFRVIINFFVASLWLFIAILLSMHYNQTLNRFVDRLMKGNGDDKMKSKDYGSDFDGNNLSYLRYILNYQSYYQPHHFRKLIKQLPETLKLKLGITLNKNNFIEELSPSKKISEKQNSHNTNTFFDSVKGDKGHVVESLTESVSSEDRVQAIRLITESKNTKYIAILKLLIRDPDDEVKRQAIAAITKFKNTDLIFEALEYLTHEDYTDLVCDVLLEIGHDSVVPLSFTFNKATVGIKSQSKIIKTIAQIPSEESIRFLINKLEYPNKSIVYEAATALKKNSFKAERAEERPLLLKAIEHSIGNCTWVLSMMSALEKDPRAQQLYKTLQEELYFTFDLLFILLELKYGKPIINFLKETRSEASSNEHREHGIEILDMVIDSKLKQKLFPILHNNSHTEILRQLENQFPISKKTPEAAIKEIVNIDLGFVTKWTKSCAIITLSEFQDVTKSDDIIAQLYNPETVLSESAIYSIKYWGDSSLVELETRLPERIVPKFFLLAENMNLNKYHFLNQKVLYIKDIQYFSKIRGESLLSLAEVIDGNMLLTGETLFFETSTDEILPLFTVAYGEVTVSDGSKNTKKLQNGHLYGLSVYSGKLKLEAVSNAFIYVLKPENVTSIVLNNEDISDALFTYLKESKIQ